MSAGTTVFAKVSLRRAGTCPVPFGRPFAMAGCVSGAFSRRGWPLAGAALPPPCCCGFGAGLVASAFAMVLASVDRLAAAAAGARLAAVAEDLDAQPRGLVAARAHDEHVGERQRPLALDDAALAQLLRRALVLLDHVDVLDEHASLFAEYAQHLAALAPLAAGDDADGVAATNVNALHQMTSGAREMILVNCRSRSSRATGPKMRVPTGFSSALMRTTAFRSKRMYEPSLRRTSFTVRTTTARATSPFFTVPSGAASFTATMTVSPSEAYRLLAPPITRMHWTFLAPELSATSSMERGWIIALGRPAEDLADPPALLLRQ